MVASPLHSTAQIITLLSEDINLIQLFFPIQEVLQAREQDKDIHLDAYKELLMWAVTLKSTHSWEMLQSCVINTFP